MLFNSLVFPIFLLATWLAWRLVPVRIRPAVLLGASYVFYGWWDWRFLGLIAASTVTAWACGRAVESPAAPRRRLWLALAVIFQLSVLGFFKYLGFFADQATAILHLLGLRRYVPVLDVVLPVGLSFFTFQALGYAVDVYLGRCRATRSLLDFALFLSFFPQLVAGPIERADNLLPQLVPGRLPQREDVAEGIHLVLWGFFKKLVVADNLAVVVASVFESPHPTGFAVLVGAWAFTWQIYCDFSGYTDIARGVSRFFGVRLMLNFHLPFFATSPRDLWRRWHISLSQWLRDCLYIPLGGNRRGPLRTQLHLVVTMVLGGLWHGANWTFVAWGAYHGLALALQRALPPLRIPRFLAMVAMFQVTALGFLVFRAHDLGHVGRLLAATWQSPLPRPDDISALVQLCVLATVPLAYEGWQWLQGDDPRAFFRLPPCVQGGVSVALLLGILVLGATAGQQFIYFQF